MRLLTLLPFAALPLVAAAIVAGAGTVAAGADPLPASLIAAVSGEWTRDETPDAAILTRAAGGMADLVVFEGGFEGLEPVLTLSAAIPASPLRGQAPMLLSTDGGFIIATEQTGAGPTPWFQRLTVQRRDGVYTVTGYGFDYYDRLAEESWGSCEVDLLRGTYTLRRSENGDETVTTGRSDPEARALADWQADDAPAACAGLWP